MMILKFTIMWEKGSREVTNRAIMCDTCEMEVLNYVQIKPAPMLHLFPSKKAIRISLTRSEKLESSKREARRSRTMR
jgi:hypothetical protein